MDEFQQAPDGDGYHRIERKCNALCVFFSRSHYYIRVKTILPFLLLTLSTFLSN